MPSSSFFCISEFAEVIYEFELQFSAFLLHNHDEEMHGLVLPPSFLVYYVQNIHCFINDNFLHFFGQKSTAYKALMM